MCSNRGINSTIQLWHLHPDVDFRFFLSWNDGHGTTLSNMVISDTPMFIIVI